jgi:hypothetical protein
MTATETATVAFADHILAAPQAHLDAEPPQCLLELLEVALDHLSAIKEVGIGWKCVELEILKGKTEKKLPKVLNTGA